MRFSILLIAALPSFKVEGQIKYCITAQIEGKGNSRMYMLKGTEQDAVNIVNKKILFQGELAVSEVIIVSIGTVDSICAPIAFF